MNKSNTEVRQKSLALCLVFFFFSLNVEARLLQVIHTNDLHSHMDYAGSKPEWGGYPAVKALIDRLKSDSLAQGVPTLTLDSGDFSEGTHFFLAENGVRSWKAMNEMGYDAVALGNHDYQIGNIGLNHILGSVTPNFALLAANYKVEKSYPNVYKNIRGAAEFVRDGLKIAVMGLTTNEFIYRWAAKPGGEVKDPIDVAADLAQKLRKRNDFVFAITHLGTKTEEKLAEKVGAIDIIFGGHSHTALFKPIYVPRKKRSDAIVVQAGEHGKWVGDMLLDLEPGYPPRVLKYKLIEVIPEETGKDRDMESFVAETRRAIDDRYGPSWLDDVIGYSPIPLIRPVQGTTIWSVIFPRTYRQATGSDIGFDVGEFYGPDQTAGDITREKLIRFFPRVFDIMKPNGWTIWTIKLQGKMITEIIRQGGKQGAFFNLDGLTYNTFIGKDGKIDFKDFKINGKKVSALKVYSVATSEGLGQGAKHGHWLANFLVKPKDSGIPIWSAVEAQLRAMNSISARP